jgi:hypothetical protein
VRPFTLLLALTVLPLVTGAAPRIGDPGWEPDPTRFDPRFPAMAEWARAGVRGGVPTRDTLPIVARVAPGEDLQAALDRAAAAGGGVVLLAAGTHEIARAVQLRSGVVLRGADRNGTVLAVRIRAPFFRVSGGPQVSAFVGRGVQRAGLEDLTIRYVGVDFEPRDFADFSAPWDRRVFHVPEDRDDLLYVHLVTFEESADCWIDGCNLLWAGAHPLILYRCQHFTLRGNRVDRAYNKMDGWHGGYYGLLASSHCLVVDEHVSRIRHFAIMLEGARYNVVLGGNFETDLNFHDADSGDNLIEGARFATPVWHSWHAVARGAPHQHQPPGSRNLLFRVEAISKGQPGFTLRGPVPERDAVYVVGTPYEAPTVSLFTATPPQAGTLYAVRRVAAP